MLRNFIFSLFFFTGIIIISIIFLPSFFLPKQVVLFGGKFMGHWTSCCLKFFLSTKIIIKGTENIIRDEKFFIASSHQSMFETFFLQTIFNSPVFILICDVGAYGMSLSSNYNLRPKPTELLIEKSKIRIINKRQNIKDLN